MTNTTADSDAAGPSSTRPRSAPPIDNLLNVLDEPGREFLLRGTESIVCGQGEIAVEQGSYVDRLFVVEQSGKDFNFPNTRGALASFPKLADIKLVEITIGSGRKLGVVVPSKAVGDELVEHVKKHMKDENPTLACYHGHLEGPDRLGCKPRGHLLPRHSPSVRGGLRRSICLWAGGWCAPKPPGEVRCLRRVCAG